MQMKGQEEKQGQRIEGLKADIERLKDAIYWALGEGGEFPPRIQAGDGAYWWRKRLRHLSGLPVKSEVMDADEASRG